MENNVYVVRVMDKTIKFDNLELALIFAKKFIKDDEMLVEVYETCNNAILTNGSIDSWFFIPYNSFYDYDKSIDELIVARNNWRSEANEFFGIDEP